MNTEYITLREAAEIHGVTRQVVGGWIRAGRLAATMVASPGDKRGALWLIKRADVLAYVPVRGPYRGRKRHIQTPADREAKHGQEPNGPTLPGPQSGQPATTTLDLTGPAIAATKPQPDPARAGYLS
jgi:excisionase family DNA binding protein